MQKLTLNVLLSLIIQSKVTGKGMTSNGRLFVMLMEIIADHNNKNLTSEENILNKFNNEVTHHNAYRKLERFLSRFIRTGQGYPYDLFSFEDFEDITKYSRFLHRMRIFVDIVIDENKRDSLVYTLLEIMRLDISITSIRYGMEDIPKERIIGSFAHPKKICIEALLLGLLYHVHKNPNAVECINLLEVDEKRVFRVVRYKNDFSLELNIPINLMENIHENAKNQKSAEMKYQLELKCDRNVISEFPNSENVFIYGSGGAGKSTLLKSLLCDKNTVNFYFPLYSYNFEIHKNFSSDSCHILLQILLKYHYQYEYQTYDALIANEGETAVLQQLTELEKMLISAPVSSKPSYTLLLDGVNEMPALTLLEFVDEIECICHNWNNVRVIITGRTIPEYRIFKDFNHIEIIGIYSDILNQILSDKNAVPANKEMYGILRMPLFLNMYLKDKNIRNTKAELLDSYIMNWKGSVVERFLLQYSLPLVCKYMLEEFSEYEITRGDLLEKIDKSIDIYINNDYVYQNYVFTRNIDKNELLQSRRNDDWIEILLRNTGLIEVIEYDSKYLKFVHQYYQDYFAAKHIINAINIFETGCKIAVSEESYFSEIGLSDEWFNYMRKFPEKWEIYKLIGELCGEYINDINKEYEREKNLLDKYLDICRIYDVEYSLENIFRIMKLMHNGIMWGMNFDGLHLPLKITSDYRFNLNGKYPCTFMMGYVFQVMIADNEVSPGRFEGCEFSDAIFLDMETKENLSRLGAICDFEDNKFISKLRKEVIVTWNDIFDMI